MFCDGVTPCPVCGRKYAHETGCKVLEMHEYLDKELAEDLSPQGGYKIDRLYVEVVDADTGEPA